MCKEKILLSLAGILAFILASASTQAGTNYTTIARQGGGNWDTGIDGTSGIWPAWLAHSLGGRRTGPGRDF
jgi:hypothetical protein